MDLALRIGRRTLHLGACITRTPAPQDEPTPTLDEPTPTPERDPYPVGFQATPSSPEGGS